jgi:transcriptional regulator with XRE-family HTH domain
VAKRFRNVIGPQVREWRIKRDLTQSALATKLQLRGWTTLDRAGVAKIESQIRSVYDYETILIADALNISPGALSPEDAALAEAIPLLIRWSGE